MKRFYRLFMAGIALSVLLAFGGCSYYHHHGRGKGKGPHKIKVIDNKKNKKIMIK